MHLSQLQKILRYQFQDESLLRTALTHKSYLDQNKKNKHDQTYQRFEFLGDRILAFIVSDKLLKLFPEADEGELAKRLNALVRAETCAKTFKELGFGKAIRMGQGEARSGGRKKKTILADCCEALIAALYLDGGMNAASDFILKNWEQRFLDRNAATKDAKTMLQEWAHQMGYEEPVYDIVKQTGSDHAPIFHIKLSLAKLDPVVAQAPSKKQAQQKAATMMLHQEHVWYPDNSKNSNDFNQDSTVS